MKIDQESRKKYASTRDFVYQSLKENMISLKLEPGESISEKDISERLQVSRTPVREAFVKLVQDELLEVYPQRGSFVALIDLEHVEEARFIRRNLEKAIFGLACDHLPNDYLQQLEFNLHMQKKCVEVRDYDRLFLLDEEFHQTIAVGCGKKRVWTVIQQMNVHVNRVRMLSLVKYDHLETILFQHEEMIRLIKNHEKLEAEKILAEHLDLVSKDLSQLKETYPNYFK